MSFVFKGQLCGYICGDCQEPLANVTVRLYRAPSGPLATALAAASPKITFSLLAEGLLAARQQALIAEGKTDAEGRFAISIGDKSYEGGAFEVDVYLDTVPNLKPSKAKPGPQQFTITTVQPSWRQLEDQYVAVWNYCLSTKQWCAVRAKFDAWVICGTLVACETKQPLGGFTVKAFDADWLGDDALGTAVTDSAGHFRIDYLGADFRKTLLGIDVTGSGPDLYFKVFDAASTLLPPVEGYARAHQPDRDDASNCFCVTLCVDITGPHVDPLFTFIGDFDVQTDIDSGSGLTNKAVLSHGGPGYGFFGTLTLKGQCPTTSGSNQPMQYRFLYVDPSNPMTKVPIQGPGLVAPVIVGVELVTWNGLPNQQRVVYVAPSVASVGVLANQTTPLPPGTGPLPAYVIIPDANGWVNVDPNIIDQGFNGPLLAFNSNAAVPGQAVPTQATAAASAGTLPPPQVVGVDLQLYFEAQPVGSASPTTSQGPYKVHVNNTEQIQLLYLAEFESGGACTPLVSTLGVQYTFDHELAREFTVNITSASPSPPPGNIVSQPPFTNPPRGGFGTFMQSISGWQKCSYIVWLTGSRKLTNGTLDDPSAQIPVSFCICQ
jgi:hypothetical protein